MAPAAIIIFIQFRAVCQGILQTLCNRVIDACVITFLNGNLSISSAIIMNFTMIDMLIYTTQIDVTISADSSIPDSVSATTLSVTSPDSVVLNGLFPSIFYYYVTPSV